MLYVHNNPIFLSLFYAEQQQRFDRGLMGGDVSRASAARAQREGEMFSAVPGGGHRVCAPRRPRNRRVHKRPWRTGGAIFFFIYNTKKITEAPIIRLT